MSAAIDDPRSAVVRRRKGVNWEKWGWVYMRASGVLLVVLIFGHLFVNLFAGEGVTQLDFGFVAGKWASPFWQWYDLLLLWFALIHGSNGIRTIINDYSTPPTGTGIRWLLTPHGIMKTALVVSSAALLILGTLVIFTFDPCPANSPEQLLSSFCTAAR